MTWLIRNRIPNEEFIAVCKSAKSMAQAAADLGLHFNSFKKRAIELGCYNTNQSGAGCVKIRKDKISLEEILNGSHPHFQTFKLKQKLLRSGLLIASCEMCGLTSWNGFQINLELDHKDGNRFNHRIENLRLLCPNCHSQTETYRSKNKSKKNLSAPSVMKDVESLKLGETSVNDVAIPSQAHGNTCEGVET